MHPSSSDRNIIQEIVVYLLKTTSIEKDEMADLIESLPAKTKDMTMSSYDMLLAEGEAIGVKKGIELERERKTEATVRKMLLSEEFKMGVLTMEKIADFAEVSIDYILDLQKVMDEEDTQGAEEKI